MTFDLKAPQAQAAGSIEVFLSYSQKDIRACERLAKELTVQGIDVLVDDNGLEPADVLKDKLAGLIERASATICLLSANSLKSPWVMWEVARYESSWAGNGKKLIPAFLDKTFLDDRFVNEVGVYIQSEISRLGNLTKISSDRGEGTRHLDNERESYLAMKGCFNRIIDRFRAIDAMSLMNSDFARTVEKIYATLSGGLPLPRPIGSLDTTNTDFSSREKEIGEMIMDGKIREALQLTLSYLRDFRAHEPERERMAIAISSKLSFIEKIMDPIVRYDLTGKIAMEILDVIGYGLAIAA